MNQAVRGARLAVLTGVAMAMLTTTAGAATAGTAPPVELSSVVTAPVPDGAPRATQYTATADGEPIGLYADTNGWGAEVAFGQFDFTGSVTVAIEVGADFDSYRLAPASLGIESTRSGSTITFTLDEPANVSLVLDGDHQGSTLHLFANAPDPDVPDPDDPDVIWIGPGYHDATDEQNRIVVGSGQTLYLAPGAYVNGRVVIDHVDDVRVRGRGVVALDHMPPDHPMIPLTVVASTNVSISGVIVSRQGTGWSSTLDSSSGVRIDNYKVVSPQYASTDALGMINVQDVVVTNSFLRSADDNVPIKGILAGGYDPAGDPALGAPNRDIDISGSQFWSDANNVITMGAETQAAVYERIRFHDNDVLYSYDDRDNHGQLDERAVMSIASLNATTFRDITFSDVRVEQAERLIALSFQPSFWFGTLPGNLTWPGHISGITFRDITVVGSTGSSEIRMAGWDADHRIDDVTLQDVTIDGQGVCSAADRHLWLNSLVSDVHLTCAGTTTTVSGPVNVPPEEDFDPDRYSAARDYSPVQGQRGWRYLTAVPGEAPVEMTWDTGLGRWRGPHQWDAVWADPQRLYLHPDGNEVWVEWTAPRAGTVRVTGTAAKFATHEGDGVRVAVRHGSDRLWPADADWAAIAFDDTVGAAMDVTLTVEQGDLLTFRLDQNVTTNADSTVWDPVITYVDATPTPSPTANPTANPTAGPTPGGPPPVPTAGPGAGAPAPDPGIPAAEDPESGSGPGSLPATGATGGAAALAAVLALGAGISLLVLRRRAATR